MSDAIEELVKEIAARHGVAMSHDDPLMILPTINQRLLADFNTALASNLASMCDELDAISQKWSDDAKARAERILTYTLNASRDHIAAAMYSGVDGLPHTVRQAVRAEIAGQLAPVVGKIRVMLWCSVVAAGALLVVAVVMSVHFVFYN